MLKTVVLMNIFVYTDVFIFQDSQINRKCSKEQHLFEIEIFSDIINAFTVTFSN